MIHRNTILAALLGAALIAPVQGADCHLSPPPALNAISFGAGTYSDDASFRLGVPFTAHPGDVVVHRMVKKGLSSAVFGADVDHKPDWFLSPRHHFPAGVRYALGQVQGSALRVFLVGMNNNPDYVFLDPDGHLCDRVGTYAANERVFLLVHGTYTATPDLAAQIVTEADQGSAAGVVIALASMDAMALTFESRPIAASGQLGPPHTVSLDRSVHHASVEGYQMDLNPTAPGELSVTVTQAPRPDMLLP